MVVKEHRLAAMNKTRVVETRDHKSENEVKVSDLSYLADMLGQPGFIARRRFLMNKTITGGFVDQGGRSFQFTGGFVTTSGGSDIFDRLTQFGTIRPITEPFGFGRFYALGAGFMIRQDNTFPVFSNKSAKKYNRHFSLVNQ